MRCSMTDQPTPSAPLKRSVAEMEPLGHVIARLAGRKCIVDAQRPEWGVPDQPSADRGSDRLAVRDQERACEPGRAAYPLVAPQAARIRERRHLEPGFGRKEWS